MILPLLFTFITSIIIIFQLCLFIGLPWGSASMGGKFPGVYPKHMRVIPLLSAVFLSFIIFIVLIKTKIIFQNGFFLSPYEIWFVVFFSFIQVILHIITPSKIEKIWLPLVSIMFITSLLIAFKY